MSNADLLLNVIDKIQRAAQRKSIDDIDDLKRINNNLITQSKPYSPFFNINNIIFDILMTNLFSVEKLENRLNHDCFDKYTTPHYVRQCYINIPNSMYIPIRYNIPL